MRRLLFLNGIKAFEAAARSGSFAAAGAELNVSAAAVSRMVHLLEDRLGVALFERKANKLDHDGGRPRLSERADADLRRAGEPHRAGDGAVERARADHRRRADLCDEMADPAAGGFSQRGTQHRRAHHHRRRGGAVRRGLELRRPARRRRVAGADRGAAVRRRSVAGLRAAACERAQASGRSQRDRACCGSRIRRTIGRCGSRPPACRA